MYNFKEV